MLIVSYAIALIVDVFFPIALAVYLRRRLGASWRFFFYGALIFAVFQLFTRVPAVLFLQSALGVAGWSDLAQWAWIFGLSLTAGIFEEVGRWVGYRWLFKPVERTWNNALMYGAGHGGIESILLVGLLSVLSVLLTVLTYSQVDPSAWNLPPALTEQVKALLALDWWLPLLGAFERVAAVTLHVGLSVVVLQVFVRGRLVWLWVAVGLHTLFNVFAVGANRLWGPVASEVFVGAFALLAIWLIFRLRPTMSAQSS